MPRKKIRTPEYYKQYYKDWHEKDLIEHPEKRAIRTERARKHHMNLRFDTLLHYSKGTPRCTCCGEEAIEFLSIDHIDGGGSRHKREIAGKGSAFYRWLRNNNYPEGFRVLCHNCNQSLGAYGYCPHHPIDLTFWETRSW